MTPADYCAQAVATPGSTTYYAAWALGASAAQARPREEFIALAALEKALIDCAEAELDRSAALAKLGFWAEELGNLLRDEATHPVAKALRALIAERPTAGARLQRAVQATGYVIEHLPAHDTSSANELALAVGGELLALNEAADDRPVADAARGVGAATQLMERLTRLATDRAAWRLLPARTRERGDHEAALRRYVGETLDLVEQHLASGPGNVVLPANVAALRAITAANAARLRKRDLNVLDARAALPPVAKLYRAWRAR